MKAKGREAEWAKVHLLEKERYLPLPKEGAGSASYRKQRFLWEMRRLGAVPLLFFLPAGTERFLWVSSKEGMPVPRGAFFEERDEKTEKKGTGTCSLFGVLKLLSEKEPESCLSLPPSVGEKDWILLPPARAQALIGAMLHLAALWNRGAPVQAKVKETASCIALTLSVSAGDVGGRLWEKGTGPFFSARSAARLSEKRLSSFLWHCEEMGLEAHLFRLERTLCLRVLLPGAEAAVSFLDAEKRKREKEALCDTKTQFV